MTNEQGSSSGRCHGKDEKTAARQTRGGFGRVHLVMGTVVENRSSFRRDRRGISSEGKESSGLNKPLGLARAPLSTLCLPDNGAI